MRLITVISIAALAAASVALAGGTGLITQSSVGKGKLGQSRSAYTAAYGKPMPAEKLEGGLTRLRYQHGAIGVYFKTGTSTGRYIVATSKAYRTAKGVGPCSMSPAVKKAYPSAVKITLAGTASGGDEFAYQIGPKLWFYIEFGNVAAVALGTNKQAAWIASNATPCGT